MADKAKLELPNKKTNFRYIYNTRRFLVWAGFLGLLSVVLIFASIVPQITSITDLYDDLLSENRRLAQLRIKVAQLVDSNDSLIITNADKINQALPSKKPLLELLSSLNTVGNSSQVRFTDISLSPGKISTESAETSGSSRSRTRRSGENQEKYEKLNLDVTVTGSINSINSFLTEIEMIAPFTTITALSLNERSSDAVLADPNQASFEAKLTITTYFFTRPVTSNIDAQLPELTVSQREIIDELQEFTYITVEQQDQIRGGGLENLFPGIGAI